MANAVVAQITAAPTSRHCFVFGLAHFLDHQATCAGNDVIQLLNAQPYARRVRYIGTTIVLSANQTKTDGAHSSMLRRLVWTQMQTKTFAACFK